MAISHSREQKKIKKRRTFQERDHIAGAITHTVSVVRRHQMRIDVQDIFAALDCWNIQPPGQGFVVAIDECLEGRLGRQI